MIRESDQQEILKNLPERPGVYQFYNRWGDIIYIGKAKNIKKRVSSYFNRNVQSHKQEILVRQIQEIKTIIVENESDALLLENNLIKEYQPKYNVLLKDDKTYPWICIKNEPFPRVFYTRRLIDDGSAYFGPYTSVVMLKALFTLIKHIYTIRTCNYTLSKENIEQHKLKKCLEFHLGNCKAPCEGLQDENDYEQSIRQIRDILRGNIVQVIHHFEKQMKAFADAYRFEEAQLIKQRLVLLENFKSKSTIVNPKVSNVEVYSFIEEDKSVYVNFIKVVKGAIVQAHNMEIVKRIDEEKEDILATAIYDLRKRLHTESDELIVPFIPNIEIENVKYTVPQRGDKKKLLNLSIRNATAYRLTRLKEQELKKRAPFEQKAMEALKEKLNLNTDPIHIECVDISNIQGKNIVASCVVFENGKSSKSEYRHYNIKKVTGANDFASIAEVVSRRFRHFIDTRTSLPDLFIIDGGKGQLNAAVNALKELGLKEQVRLIAIAKRLEEIYIPGDPVPLYLDKNSPALKLVQQLRNEAHRFGITFHRKKRSNTMLESELDHIEGIGIKSKEKLLAVTSDVHTLKVMSIDEISAVIGKRGAEKLYAYFHRGS